MIAGVLCGATASGKSALALKLARTNGFEIISADSRQIYRGFEIGTNAPSQADRTVPHHLIGFVDPSTSFSPRAYPAHVHALVTAHPNTRFLIVGGTGLYLKELIYPSPFDRGPTPDAIKQNVQEKIAALGLPHMYAELLRVDPTGAAGLHPNDGYRIAKRWENFLITGESYSLLTGPQILDERFANVPLLCLDVDRPELYLRIDQRVEAMLQSGWLDEVRGLMSIPDWKNLPAFSSLGYGELAAVVSGKMGLAEAKQYIQKQTRNYAKRQITFFGHQLPGLQHWAGNELVAALNGCDWSWKVFSERFSVRPQG
jgi:tRNA dimethylallyltransferase